MEVKKISLNAKIFVEANEVDAVVIDGGLFVKVMDVPEVVGLEDSEEVVDDTKTTTKTTTKKKTTGTKTAAKKTTAKKTTKKSGPTEVEDWSTLEEGDAVKVKLGEEFLEEDDDPDTLYNCKVTDVDAEDSECIQVSIDFLDDEMKDEEGNPSSATIDSTDGSIILA